MPIQLTDAIERAELMSDDGLLPQQSYDLLVQKLDDEDRHPFTMALVDRGIIVKNSRIAKSRFLEQFFNAGKVAQTFVQREDSPLWVPDTWDNEEEWQEVTDDDIEDVSDLNFDVGESQYGVDTEDAEVSNIKSVLESNGISLNSDGTVNFYKSSIPGVYKDRLPQAMDLDKAIQYFDQVLDMTDSQQAKMDDFIDLLSRLTSEVYDIEYSLEELENYKFSPQSRDEFTSGISKNLDSLRSTISEGNWSAAQDVLEKMKGTVDQWLGDKDSYYDQNLSLVDALDQLAELRDTDSAKYQSIVEGLGGVPN